MRAMASNKPKAKTTTASGAGAYVALLRGINVGGKRSLPMKRLLDVFVAAGCEDVRTYIQSGNVVFRAPPALAARLSSVLPRAIAKAAGFDVPVVLRSAGELAAAVRNNPFLKMGSDAERCHLLFLADVPDAARVKKLDASRSPPDELAVVGRDVYLLLPNGVARSKLTNAYFDSALATVSTLRNWRTVLTLLDMAAAGPSAAEPAAQRVSPRRGR
jgi:uncharacterized protein (DUF1697 family)